MMSITTTSNTPTTVTKKELKDMNVDELLAEAMKELQEIKRMLGINEINSK